MSGDGRPALAPDARRHLVSTYLEARDRARANPRQPGRPRLDGRPVTIRELAATYGIAARTAWRYVAAARP